MTAFALFGPAAAPAPVVGTPRLITQPSLFGSDAAPARCSRGRKRKVSDGELLLAYRETGSVWKAGEKLGICGQSAHERLTRIGAVKPVRPFTDDDKALIISLYRDGFAGGDGKLEALAKQIGRTKSFVCRFARSEGLTNQGRKLSPKASAAMSVRVRRQWQNQPHPRGAAGMRHDEGTKMLLSWQSRARHGSMTPDQRAAITRKQLVTRVQRHGSLAMPRAKTTWKQGWREIAGRRIYFRSRWEFNYAVYLQFIVDQKQIAGWEHEPETFWFEGIRRGCVSYLPDYRITNNDGSVEYHEVKGWMDARSKTKLKRMKKYYPTVKLRVIGAKWFKANGPKLAFLKGWES